MQRGACQKSETRHEGCARSRKVIRFLDSESWTVRCASQVPPSFCLAVIYFSIFHFPFSCACVVVAIMTFRSSNDRLKNEFNTLLLHGVADVGALHREAVQHVQVAMLDAMDGEGVYPRTARALGQAGISPANMRLISCNPLEAAQMRSAIHHTPLHGAGIFEVALGREEPLPFARESLHLCILDGCSGRPNTLKMMREMLPFLLPGAVVVLGITRRHNQDPLPEASQCALEACVEEEEDPCEMASRLKRIASVQLVQHRTQLDMHALGAQPFWPMWHDLGALSFDGYGEQNLMVYMAFVVGGGHLLSRPPSPLRWYDEEGVRLLEREFAPRTLRRIRALKHHRETRRQATRRRKHEDDEDETPLATKRLRKMRSFYDGVYSPPRTAPAPRIPVGSRWKYVERRK